MCYCLLIFSLFVGFITRKPLLLGLSCYKKDCCHEVFYKTCFSSCCNVARRSSSHFSRCFSCFRVSVNVVKIRCDICFDEFSAQNFPLKCHHHACKNCLKEMVDIAIKDKSTADLKCSTCNKKIDNQEIAIIVDNNPAIIQSLSDIAYAEFLKTQPNARYCPTVNCTHAYLLDTRKRPETMRCPKCHQQYCSDCLINHGAKTTCAQAKAKSNTANEEWIRNNTKPCPQCKAPIEKAAGCNHMQCRECNKHFCWHCGIVSDNYVIISSHALNEHRDYHFCYDCGFSSKDVNELRAHQLAAHGSSFV